MCGVSLLCCFSPPVFQQVPDLAFCKENGSLALFSNFCDGFSGHFSTRFELSYGLSRHVATVFGFQSSQRVSTVSKLEFFRGGHNLSTPARSLDRHLKIGSPTCQRGTHKNIFDQQTQLNKNSYQTFVFSFIFVPFCQRMGSRDVRISRGPHATSWGRW